MEKAWVRSFLWFMFQVTVVHFITYWIFGFIAFTVYDYQYWFSVPPLSNYMRPTSSIWVISGPLFALIRGPIMALVLYPFRSVFVDQKYGWLYLWGLFIGLAILNCPGPAPGSIEGMVFTIVPIWMQLAFLPETVLQTLALSILVVLWQHHPDDKRILIPMVTIFIIMLALSVLSVLFFSGVP